MAAHTSAGKTVVAEYAIALSQKHMTRFVSFFCVPGCSERNTPSVWSQAFSLEATVKLGKCFFTSLKQFHHVLHLLSVLCLCKSHADPQDHLHLPYQSPVQPEVQRLQEHLWRRRTPDGRCPDQPRIVMSHHDHRDPQVGCLCS